MPSIQFEGGIRSVLQLQSAGFDPKTSERLLTELSNQVALTGKSADDLNRALYQFTQIGGLQEFRTEELRQIFEIVPQMRQIFEELFGTFSGDEINKAMENLGLTFDQAMGKLLDRLEQGPRAPEDTLANKVEQLNDTMADFVRELKDVFLPLLKGAIDFTKGGVRSLTEIVGYFGQLFDVFY